MAKSLAKITILELNLAITFFLHGQSRWSFLRIYRRHLDLSTYWHQIRFSIFRLSWVIMIFLALALNRPRSNVLFRQGCDLSWFIRFVLIWRVQIWQNKNVLICQICPDFRPMSLFCPDFRIIAQISQKMTNFLKEKGLNFQKFLRRPLSGPPAA